MIHITVTDVSGKKCYLPKAAVALYATDIGEDANANVAVIGTTHWINSKETYSELKALLEEDD